MEFEQVRRESQAWQETYRSNILAKRRWAAHRRKLERIGISSADRNLKILDVCCGEGEMLGLLAGQGFKNLLGVDLADDPVILRERAGKPWKYIASSATHLPFQENSFDWILCAHSLHHLTSMKNIEALLRDAYDGLKPGGQLAIIDHYDAPQVRLAFAVLFSPLACLTPYTRFFRQQHLEEKEYLYEYLNHWPDLIRLFSHTRFSSYSLKKGLFFFYFVATK